MSDRRNFTGQTQEQDFLHYAFDSSKHPRGNPKNKGQFAKKGTGSAQPEDERPELLDAIRDYGMNGVQAQSFKAWFGDWEKNPATSSKVVDSKGEPQETYEVESSQFADEDTGQPVTVYHGTPQNFDAFDPGKDSGTNLYGPGFYFTESREIAAGQFTRETNWEPFDSKEEAKEATWTRATGLDKYHDPYLADSTGKWMAAVESIKKLKHEGYAHKAVDIKKRSDRLKMADAIMKASEKRSLANFERERLIRDVNLYRKGKIDFPLISSITRDQPYSINTQSLAYDLGLLPSGHVHECYLNIRNPFRIDAKIQPAEQNKLAQAAEEFLKEDSRAGILNEGSKQYLQHLIGQWSSPSAHPEKGDYFWQSIQNTTDKAIANAILEKAGYDGLTHIGGGRFGRSQLSHRVWIAFSPTQVKAVDNRGTFSLNDTRMKYRKETRFGVDRLEPVTGTIGSDATPKRRTKYLRTDALDLSCNFEALGMFDVNIEFLVSDLANQVALAVAEELSEILVPGSRPERFGASRHYSRDKSIYARAEKADKPYKPKFPTAKAVTGKKELTIGKNTYKVESSKPTLEGAVRAYKLTKQGKHREPSEKMKEMKNVASGSYTVHVHKNGNVSCNCPSYKIGRPKPSEPEKRMRVGCKHCEAVKTAILK